jgi:hypothetical protein
MEGPVLALKPGLERLAVILDDPAVDTIPDTLRKINAEVMPLVKGIQETQGKVNNIATLAEETSNRLAGLPGMSTFFGRRRNGPTSPPAEPAETGSVPDYASPSESPGAAESSAAPGPPPDEG